MSFSHTKHSLSNGLPVVVVPRTTLHTSAVALYARVGPMYERGASQGLSHFLEHMLYRGTATLPTAHDQALAFERLGGMLYAATATDHGVMTLSLPPESLNEALRLLGEVLQTPRFTALEIERGIVREEILEDLDEDGRLINADKLIKQELYDDHPLAAAITGSLEQLDLFDEQAVRAHHEKHYVASNLAIAISGAVDESSVLPVLEQALGGIRVGQRVEPAAPAPLRGKRALRYVESEGSQTSLRIAFRGPAENTPTEPATEMLLRIIDDGMSTRLYERLCDSKGLCYDVSAEYETFANDAIFDFSTEAQHERAPEVIAEIQALCREMAEHGPTDDELDRARARARWSTRALLDDAEGLAAVYGLALLADVANPPERCDELVSVTRSQIRDAATTLFDARKMATVAVGTLPKAALRRLEKLVKSF
ncbi:MAG: pitrilysin family protein [Polyangiaceae bacterium]